MKYSHHPTSQFGFRPGGVVDLGVVVLVCIVYRVVLMRGGGIGWGMTVFWLFSGGCVVWFAEEWVCIAGSDGLNL